MERIADPKGFILDPYLALYLPLYELDGTQFMSKDAYGHLCTKTGALWRPQGHYFDGIDDKIACGTNPILMSYPDGLGIMAWVKRGVIDAYHGIASVGPDAASWTKAPWVLRITNGNLLSLVLNDGNDDSQGATSIDTADWYCVAGTYDLVTSTVLVNGEVDGSNAYSTALSVGEDALRIGEYRESLNFKGDMGELWLWKRAPSIGFMQRKYLETKWRYR